MEEKHEKNRKRGWISLFAGLLFLPALLYILSAALDCTLDAELSGYTNSVEELEFHLDRWFNGTFQTNWSDVFAENFLPRGMLIKTYNTLNYCLFRKSDRIIGKHDDIFEPDYIYAELALTAQDDFSRTENVEKMTEYVCQLQVLNELLREKGKYLYVYVAPSKASAHRENIPDQYIQASLNHARAVDVFREKISASGIPFLICNDLLSELEYPSFYSTGIHWSRTYEQLTSQRILAELSDLTGKMYRNIQFTGVEESTTPWFRDSDVYDLLNVFLRPEITYYQYQTALEERENAEPLKILIQGDSFALGLRKDFIENDENAEVYYVSRDETIVDRNEVHNVFYQNWAQVDWENYIERVDVVVIEATEALLRECSFGFVPQLLSVLQANKEEMRD